jgi:hypothetical protein
MIRSSTQGVDFMANDVGQIERNFSSLALLTFFQNVLSLDAVLCTNDDVGSGSSL